MNDRINSLRPSDAYMHQLTRPSLVQIIACRLLAPSHNLNQCWLIVNWKLGNKIQWNFNQNSNIFIQENAFEYAISKKEANLSGLNMLILWDHATKLFHSSTNLFTPMLIYPLGAVSLRNYHLSYFTEILEMKSKSKLQMPQQQTFVRVISMA